MNQQEIEFLKTLTPPPLHWQGMGALKYRYNPNDWDVRSLPGVCEAIEAGIPDDLDIDLTRLIQGEILNQGATGACVAFSTSHVAAMDDVLETRQWPNINAPLVYSRAGGMGQNGVDSALVLKQAVEMGMPLIGGGAVKTIASYAYVPQQLGVFTQTIEAALMAGYPMVLALLLPSDFGWECGHGARTSGYHQIGIIGRYKKPSGEKYWRIVNSWGPSWPGNSPHPGVGSILQSYCEADSFQNGYVFSYTVTPLAVPNPTPIPTPTPVPDPTPIPVPPPARQATVGGRAIAGRTNGVWPKVGDTVPFGQDVTLHVTSLVYDGDPTPNPQPNPQPQPDPAPDGGIQVFLTTKPSQFRNTVSIVVYTADKDGHSFPASVNGTVTGPNGVVPLQGMTTHGTQSPVIYTVDRPAPWGTPCTVEINAFNGQASGSATKPG